ncbi:unnamed protein product, partial [Acanthoscelides obtectus]
MGDYGKPSMAGSPSKDSMGGKTAVSGFCARSAPTSLRRPPSSRFPPAAAAAGRFRKGIAAKCTWRCAAVAFIALSVGLVAALTYISASSLLNWSYQNTKPCVLVGDNTQVVPASKSATSETNLSTSTRPKTQSSNTGGKYVDQVYARRRRQVSNDQHVFVLSNPPASTSGQSSLHDGTSLHDLHGVDSLSTNTPQDEAATEKDEVITAEPASDESVSDEVHVATEPDYPMDAARSVEDTTETASDTIEVLPTVSVHFNGIAAESGHIPEQLYDLTEDVDITTISNETPQSSGQFASTTTSATDTNMLNRSEDPLSTLDDITTESSLLDADPSRLTTNEDTEDLRTESDEETHDISDSSLFTLDEDIYEDMKRDYEEPPKSAEFQHDAPIFSVKAGNTDSEEKALLEKVQGMSKKPLEIHPSLEDVEPEKRFVQDGILEQSEGDSFLKAQDSSKELTDANLSIVPLNQTPDLKPGSFNNPMFVHNPTNQDANRFKVLDVPPAPSMHPNNRFLVNVTIAADNTQPVYVLSVSVPMDGKGEVQVMSKEAPEPMIEEKEKKAPVGLFDEEKDASGGACECSCPCLDSSNDFSDGNSSLEFDYDALGAKETETTVATTTELTESTLSTATACPEVTVPPPMILVLEGARTFPAQSFPPDGTTFSQISLGQRLSREIRPYGYWNMQFYQSEAAYVQFDYIIPRGASIGVYARRNALPTHTQYHILEVLSGFKARTSRASHSTVKKEVTHYMEQGHWFLSLYNDDGEPQEVTFVATIAEDMTHNCPNGCSGNGDCLMGHCQCNPGFGGDDCSDSVCPVLCSQRGEYINGECQCNPGWKGKECELRHDECEVPDCNGHGHCANGKCNCIRGYKGKYCEEADCPHPTCSSHGYCVEGTCICKKGWKGLDCSQMDKEALQCLPDCSGHGTFDLETQTCTCEPRWSSDDCSKELCDLDCGSHGHCVSDACQCDPGWSGEFCNLKECDPRCNEHGQCKNGTCLCVTGWNGKHCTIEGCPNSCSSHGQCRFSSEGMWECRCDAGWDGRDCSILLEQNCNDGRDNDKDGLVDCEDPECCLNHVCKSSQLCVSSPKPIDILLRKQPPAITASFFERMKFLIDEGSLQNYARQETFNESRSAVVRGRVTTQMGLGLMGVRVSTSTPLEGFTLTRDDGWFDLLVNGGGAVTLQFGRAPFSPQSRIVFVPWNDVVIVDDVVMTVATSEERLPTALSIAQPCKSHDYDTMRPVVLATWKHGFQGACADKSAILVESQVVQESLRIPGTGLNLVYHSSRAAGYLSTIQLQLTPDVIPKDLKLIHLRITIEGILFEKVFEADPVIKFTYAWNRLNVYRQRVYGVTTAIVKVGYEYTDCKSIIWDVQTTKLSGHDMSISEVGGWNLDIHHRYNFHEGILQKGDGSNIYLKHKPRVILTAMGDGHQRPLECSECEGQATKQRLLAPVALAAATDGSLFVGDFNLVRKIQTDGIVRTVVKLNATRVSYRYHMALSLLDGILYISDPESHQILRVRNINDFSDPERNWETAVGSGERCLPGDEAHCGDGAPARDAKLAYPKGVAVSNDNVLYFADGTNIRMVDRDGIVTTVIGNHMHKSHWKPLPCEGTLNVEEVHLRWPTELAINPLDNTLHIIDDHMILQLTQDGRVKVIAGRPLHCASPLSGYDIELATHATLVMPQSIAFSSTGDLYVAESDSQRINRVRMIGTDGKISPYAGAESKCNCLERGCDCFEADHFLAANAKFNTISAVTVTPDGHVHIGDQANYRIRSVMASIPDASMSREYEIYSPETQEVYIFNRFGQHIATRNILTGETSYIFNYNVNTSNGKLSTVTDTAGNKVFLLRDYSSLVNSIENTKGQKCRLRMSRMRLLHELSTPDNYNVTFDYHGPTGLLKSKLDSSGRSYVYNYDEFGRLVSAVTPTGKAISLSFDLSLKGATVQVKQNDKKPVSMLIKGSSVSTKIEEVENRIILLADGSAAGISSWSHTVTTDTVPYNILADKDPLLGESYPVPAKQRTEIGGDLANRFEWRYFVRPNLNSKNSKSLAPRIVTKVGKKLRVNGENLLTMEYDRETASVSVFLDDKAELLNVTYDRSARPVKWGPRNGLYTEVELEYDRFSRLSSWKWGDLSESYGF